jgi:GDP-L-fucose synthase
MNLNSKIYVAGHRGMVGSAICRNLVSKGYSNIITRSKSELNLLDTQAVKVFFEQEKPDYVFLAAAKVGGIIANNTYRGDFLYENLQIQNNVIHNAYLTKVEKLVFLGSSCIYPKNCPQPIKEEYLLTGLLEPTNEPYAIAKIAGIKMCEAYRDQYGCNFISVMPTNLYGINDNYHPENSHVFPALIRKFHEAKMNGTKEVIVWGSGKPRREFLNADDMADATVFLMQNYNSKELVNIGVGKDISIGELAHLIKEELQYDGNIIFDSSKPDGIYQKLLCIDKLNALGWQAKTSLREGIALAYKNFIELYSQ